MWLPDRPGKPKLVVQVKWGRRVEELIRWILNHQLWKSFSCIPEDVGDNESERTMFKASIVEVVVMSCGQGHSYLLEWQPLVLLDTRSEGSCQAVV